MGRASGSEGVCLLLGGEMCSVVLVGDGQVGEVGDVGESLRRWNVFQADADGRFALRGCIVDFNAGELTDVLERFCCREVLEIHRNDGLLGGLLGRARKRAECQCGDAKDGADGLS